MTKIQCNMPKKIECLLNKIKLEICSDIKTSLEKKLLMKLILITNIKLTLNSKMAF